MWGNWSQKKQLRNYISTPNKGLRQRIEKYMKILLVDEFNTSKKCTSCECVLEKFMYRENPKPYKSGKDWYIVYYVVRTRIAVNYMTEI